MVTKTELLSVVDSAIISSKDEAAIAAAFNAASPRTKVIKTAIGIGTIIETLGVNDGNNFLDFIWSNPDFRWVKVIIEKGELNTGSELVRQTIDALVGGGVLGPDAGAALKATAEVPDNLTGYEVATILQG